jgi:HTH-type transcriptional regulator/antitoxin HipB
MGGKPQVSAHGHARWMDDQRIGSMLRAIRVRKGWRQSDLAAKAGVSATVVARAERGDLASIPMGKVRRVTEALGARFEPIIRWQGADLGRLLASRHAGMHEAMAAFLSSLDGWLFEPEVSFSIYGERGIIDVLAWHPSRRMLLVIELKTELVEVSGLIGSMDQRRRLAWRIARERGWDPVAVSTWVVIADSRTNRRAVAAHSGVLRAKMPVDGRGMRAWLRNPSARVDALGFLPYRHAMALGRRVAPVKRVLSRKARSTRA